MYVHRSVEHITLAAPHLRQNLLARKDAAWVAQQQAKDAQFLGREAHLFAVDKDHLAQEVRHNAARMDGLCRLHRCFVWSRLTLVPAQHSLDAGQHFVEREGLGDIVVGPCCKALQ